MLSATWQRYKVHFMRNTLTHAGKSERRVVSAFIAMALAQDTPDAASTGWRNVADQIRPKMPKFATLMDSARAVFNEKPITFSLAGGGIVILALVAHTVLSLREGRDVRARRPWHNELL